RATDVGVVVADAWQSKGVGAALMRALIARAQARGVTTLAMDVLPGNRRVLAMILRHWPDAAVRHSPDRLHVPITLPPAPPRLRPASTRVRPLVLVGGEHPTPRPQHAPGARPRPPCRMVTWPRRCAAPG